MHLATKIDEAKAIARDVLERLSRRTHKNNVYLAFKLGVTRFTVDEHKNDMQAVTEKLEASCRVCLLGSLLLSKARLFNAVPLADIFTDVGAYGAEPGGIFRHLLPIFGEDLLLILESYFEGRVMCAGENNVTSPKYDTVRAAALEARGKSLEDRVQTAMRLVAEHGGFPGLPPVSLEYYAHARGTYEVETNDTLRADDDAKFENRALLS